MTRQEEVYGAITRVLNKRSKNINAMIEKGERIKKAWHNNRKVNFLVNNTINAYLK